MTKSAVPTSADPAILAAWQQEAEKEIAGLTSAIVPLQAQLEAARERLDLIRRLARLANGNSHEETVEVRGPGVALANEVEDHLEQLLQSSGIPMHISEIRQKLIERGVPLPGRGDEANIILRLRRDPVRFLRTGRGMYGLASWNLPEVPPTATRRKLRRRRRSST
jgi:hypothetical protein